MDYSLGPEIDSDIEHLQEVATEAAHFNNLDTSLRSHPDSTPDDLSWSHSASESESESKSSSGSEDLFDDSLVNEHRHLWKLIERHRTIIRQKKTIISDNKAAKTLIDLEALSQYNDMRFKLHQDWEHLKKSCKLAAKSVQPRLRLQLGNIKPAMDASKAVASWCSQGPLYAWTLHSTAYYLLRTGLLPENQQGKGAEHSSLLANPQIAPALQLWVKGTLLFEEGGFNGRVSHIFQC